MTEPSLFDRPKRPKENTQAARLLEALETGPVCSFRFYDTPGITHRVAARVHDLRKAGWPVDAVPCGLHVHDAAAVMYTLETVGGVVGLLGSVADPERGGSALHPATLQLTTPPTPTAASLDQIDARRQLWLLRMEGGSE